jgi:hypothetical protein
MTTKKIGDDKIAVDRGIYKSMKEVADKAIKHGVADKDPKTGLYLWIYNPKLAEKLEIGSDACEI